MGSLEVDPSWKSACFPLWAEALMKCLFMSTGIWLERKGTAWRHCRARWPTLSHCLWVGLHPRLPNPPDVGKANHISSLSSLINTNSKPSQLPTCRLHRLPSQFIIIWNLSLFLMLLSFLLSFSLSFFLTFALHLFQRMFFLFIWK